jgi:para-aminobenzoate synthetase component 1
MKKLFEKTIDQDYKLKERLLAISEKFDVFNILDSNHWKQDSYHLYDLLGAFGAANEIETNTSSFSQLQTFYETSKEWCFGFLSYDLKNELENLYSENTDEIQAPNLYFFNPKLLIILKGDLLEILVHEFFLDDKEILRIVEFIIQNKKEDYVNHQTHKIKIENRINKEDYFSAIANIKSHIKHGDIYELNFCQEFYAKGADIHPQLVYQKLIDKSPTPFSSFMCKKGLYILSASPERYLKKQGNIIISQPIKGTARRKSKTEEDTLAKKELQNNSKERAENIMIVDLVRNDLSHTAVKGSVKVEELCKIYSFEQVHQMISTIRSELNPEYTFVDVLKTTFPMGSMTGAPKIKAMELIEEYESSKRGIYSGAIGYITPEEDFDFNVIIRTLIYNKKTKYLSFIAGGAITFQSEAEKEYEESLLKAEAIREILS